MSGGISAEWVNPFVTATTRTIETMAGMACRRTGLRVERGSPLARDVSGVIGIAGAIDGAVAVSLPWALAVRIVERMLGQAPESDASVRDGIGELVNVIAGHAKGALAGTAYAFQIALPMVIVGAGHAVWSPGASGLSLAVDFEVEGDPFTLQVCIRGG